MPIPLNQREPLLLSNQNLDQKDYKVFNKLMSYKVNLIFKTKTLDILKSLTSEATPLTTNSFKISASLPDYKHTRMLCLPLRPRQKVLESDFQSEFSMSKIIQILLIFFSMKNKSLRVYFFVKMIFGNFNFKTTLFTKIISDF